MRFPRRAIFLNTSPMIGDYMKNTICLSVFHNLKQFCKIVTRHNMLDVSFLAFVYLAYIDIIFISLCFRFI